MQIDEAIERFKLWRGFKVKSGTVKGYDMVLRQFGLYMRNCAMEDVRIDDVMSWFQLMQKFNWDYNSFIPKAMALRKFFEYWHRQGYSVIDPWLIPIPHKQCKIPRIADEANYKKLLRIVPKKTNDPRHVRNLAIINLLWDTGARNGELMSLNVGDIELTRRRAIIRTEKSKGWRPIREIFWTEGTNKNIERWMEKREHLTTTLEFKDPEALFVSVCNQKNGQRFSLKGVGEMLRHYSNRAKIPYMNAHSFRHHMGHHIIKSGGSSADVMNILGHASVQSSSIYTMMSDRELEQRYRKFNGR